MLVMSNLNQLDDNREPPTELVSQDNDRDSAVGLDDDELSTVSLRSSVCNFPTRHGRTYNAFCPNTYFAPNDRAEQDRMDMQYEAIMEGTGNKSFHAPVCYVRRVLDLGTGIGRWAVEMGDNHPEASIIGFDISPIQPDWVPLNVSFEVTDVEESWDLRRGSFDLIHSGQMLSGIIRDRQRYFQQAFRYCKPGGYFEVKEICMKTESDQAPVPDDAGMRKWYKNMCDGIAGYGGGGRRFHHDLSSVVTLMEEAGFVEIDSRPYKIPLGRWPKLRDLKKAGVFQLNAMVHGLEGLTLAPLIEGLGWEKEEVEVLLADARTDAQAEKKYYYFNGYVVWGRKPLGKDMASAALWSTVPSSALPSSAPPSSAPPSSTAPSRNETCSNCETRPACSDQHGSGDRSNLKRKRS